MALWLALAAIALGGPALLQDRLLYFPARASVAELSAGGAAALARGRRFSRPGGARRRAPCAPPPSSSMAMPGMPAIAPLRGGADAAGPARDPGRIPGLRPARRRAGRSLAGGGRGATDRTGASPVRRAAAGGGRIAGGRRGRGRRGAPARQGGGRAVDHAVGPAAARGRVPLPLAAGAMAAARPLRQRRPPGAASAGRWLVVVAERDDIVPARFGTGAVRRAWPSRKRLLVLPGAGHNDWPARVDAAWWQQVVDFLLARAGKLQGGASPSRASRVAVADRRTCSPRAHRSLAQEPCRAQHRRPNSARRHAGRQAAAPHRRPARPERLAAAGQPAADRAGALPPAAGRLGAAVRPLLQAAHGQPAAAGGGRPRGRGGGAARPARGLPPHRPARGHRPGDGPEAGPVRRQRRRLEAPAAHGDGGLRPGPRQGLLPVAGQVRRAPGGPLGRRPQRRQRPSTCRPT